jgi:hypothetical protein
MGKKLTATGSDRDFEILDAGTHIAICTAVVAIGPQETHFGEKDQIKIRFEVPAERVEYEKDGVMMEGPMVIWNTYTASLSEKANLRKDLEAWRGRVFTDEELDGWDIGAILGKPCMITVVHRESGGREFANVSSVTGLPKGTQVAPHEGELIDFDNDNFTQEEFDALPSWLRDKVREGIKLAEAQIARTEAGNQAAAEAAQRAPAPPPAQPAPTPQYPDGVPAPATPAAPPAAPDFTDDDIPF